MNFSTIIIVLINMEFSPYLYVLIAVPNFNNVGTLVTTIFAFIDF